MGRALTTLQAALSSDVERCFSIQAFFDLFALGVKSFFLHPSLVAVVPYARVCAIGPIFSRPEHALLHIAERATFLWGTGSNDIMHALARKGTSRL